MAKEISITTINSDALSLYTPVQRRKITGAYAALSGLEPSAARIRRAAVAVGTLRGYGLSIRGIVGVMSLEGNGTLPTGKGTIERLGYVADAIGGEWPDTGDSADGILMALYRIAQTGKAADVARAAEVGRAAADGDSAFTAVDAVRLELNAAQHKSLTTDPARKPSGKTLNPAGHDTDDDTDTDTDDVAPPAKGTTRAAAEGLAGATVLSLIAELTRRVGGKGFTPDAVVSDAFDLLVSSWEERVTTDAAVAAL